MPRVCILVCCVVLFALSGQAQPSTIVGEQYLAISQIHPGQLRYSDANVEDKIAKAKKKGKAICDSSNHCTFKHDDGRSILSKKDALPVIASPVGYVLVDGHHDVMTSLRLGATTVPVTKIADFRHLSEQEFWDEAAKRGLAYPYAIGGVKKNPPSSFSELVNDPNRYFAAIAARKCSSSMESPDETSGYNYPLWVKVGEDIPFIEFKISDALNSHGFVYDDKIEDLPDNLVEEARQILRDNPIPSLRLVPQKTLYSDVENLCGLQPYFE